MKMKSFLVRWFVPGLLAMAQSAAPGLAGAKQLWTAKLPGDAKWHPVTQLGTLLVGTPEAIVSFDPESGEQLWQRGEFKKSEPRNG